MTTREEFKSGAHCAALKAFLTSNTGVELLALLERRARPSADAKKQYGGAEDVKLQMSLNYVKMAEAFEIIEFIQDLAAPSSKVRPFQPLAPELLPDDPTPEQLAAAGVQMPQRRAPAPPVSPVSTPESPTATLSPI